MDYKIFRIIYSTVCIILGLFLLWKFQAFITQWDTGGLTAFRARWVYVSIGAVELIFLFLFPKLKDIYRWWKKNQINIFIMIITTIAGIFLLEIILRVTNIGGLSHNIEIRKLHTIMQDDPDLGFAHKPNLYNTLNNINIQTNKFGFRDREFTFEKPINTKRIMVLGDSVVFGWGVSSEYTFCKQMESIWNQDTSRDKIEVINTGVCAYNTLQEKEFLLKKGLQFNPDIVVLVYVINDPEPTIHTMKQKPDFIRIINQIYVKHALDQLLVRMMSHKEADAEFTNLGPGWKASREAIMEMHQICLNHNIEFILIFYDMAHAFAEQKAFPLLQELAGQSGFPVYSTYSWFAPYRLNELVNSLSDSHPNPKAHKIMAEKLLEIIRLTSIHRLELK